mgnify:CR=1 FL=1
MGKLRNMNGKVKTGLPPGSFVYTGDKHTETKMTLFEYNRDDFKQNPIDKCPEFKNKDTVKWIKINGFLNQEKIIEMGQCFNLHDLVLEDILDVHQRPKIDSYTDYLFVVLKLNDIDSENRVIPKQISLVLHENVLISFQDDDEHVFEKIIGRLKIPESSIRQKGTDYLFYSLIDTIIDSYFDDLGIISDIIEIIDDKLMERPEPDILKEIHKMKINVITLKKSVWPVREMLDSFESYNYPLINKSTDYYIRDVYDHSIQAFDMIESLRDRISEMLDIYLSSVSNKLNEIVRVLTIISTIFVPLTFIVGLYGMNFRYMPEIGYKYSYFLVLLVMFLIAVVMLFYFRRKKWI